MPTDRFLIAPLNSGLTRNSPAWLQPDDAFEYLQNAYVFRQRVRKRFGSEFMGLTQLQSRLRTSLISGGAGVGITTGGGAAAGNVRTILADASLPLAAGQMFSVGGAIYTVISNAAGAQAMLATQGTGTFNVSNGDFTITGAPALTTVFFYPSFPVMGIEQYDINTVNNHPTYAFDTRYAYVFTPPTGWARSGAAIWHGTDLNFFWVTNWQGIAGTQYLFVSNFNGVIGAATPPTSGDPIWYFDGTTWTAALGGTANAFYFRPNGGAPATGPYVSTARIIVPFKNRLLLLNTIENDNAGGAGTGTTTAFVNRLRYSFYGSPFAVNAWYEKNQQDNVPNVASGAGFVDAATEEQIISAEFIKDRLIVYFERSTWEVVYTNNQVLPFVWQKINTELGSMSTFSTVPFDKDVLTIGQSGVHACNGQNTIRIDSKIPDKIFEFETDNNSNLRTVGIRDYYTELVYWTYVEDLHQAITQKFPNQIMIYNYKNGSWAFNDDCATMFGYFEQASDSTWASTDPLTWAQSGFAWNSNVVQANQRQIIFGTPEGFVLILNPERYRNAPSLQITNMAIAATGIITLTIINHNLTSQPIEFDFDNDFILLESIVADATTMTTLNGTIFNVESVVDANNVTINTNNRSFAPLVSGTYAGGGTAARVSNIQIKSKQWNPYVEEDRSFYLAKIDFAVVKTETGEITVDYYPSSSQVPMIQEGVNSESILGNSILETKPYNANIYPFETFQDLLWHPIYFQSVGTFIQIGMSFNLDQMLTPAIVLVGFEIQAMALYTQATSSRME